MAGSPLDTALDALDRLLEEQAAAMLGGNADALAPLAASLNRQLAAVRSTLNGLPSEPQQTRLRALHSRARANNTILSRRQIAVQRALDALGQGDSQLQDAQSNRVYAAAGRMSSPAVRGRAFAQA